MAKQTPIFFLIVLAILAASCTKPASNETTNGTANSIPVAVEDSAPSSGGGEVVGDPPEKLVTELYKAHDAKKGPFFQKNRARIDQFFTKQLGDLVYRDATAPEDGVGALGADPLYGGQDFEIKNFTVGKGVVTDGKATVNVTFTNFGEKNTVVFSLADVSGSWRISDIKYSHGGALLAMLRETYGDGKTNAPPKKNVPGEFEGTYRVGDTTCTVQFKNKGFAVRWAKGSGEEYFSFMGGTTFASSTVESEANKFIFDDENYNSGTFVRADGKTFPVSRAR